MKNFSTSPREMVASFWCNRSLIKALVWREVVGRYQGSFLGILWSFINPVFMLAIYTFVFSVVFKMRWIAGSDSKTEFALILFAGLMVFNLFAECISRSPGLILSNTNYVKKVVFPLEILPLVALGSSFFHTLVSLAVWLIFYIIFMGIPHATAWLLPLILVPLLLLTLGIGWVLSSLGVFFRDVGQMVGLGVTALMFLSPIFFPLSALPKEYQSLLKLNPLTLVVEQVRDVLYWGKIPNFSTYGIYLVISILVAWGGFAWFQKTRKGFADVL